MDLNYILLCIITTYLILLTIALIVRKIIQIRLRKILLNTLPVLNDNKIDYWVDFGTLLGIHRNKDIIIGDNDCDICIWEKDQDKVRDILKEFSNSNKEFEFKEYDWGAFRIHYNFLFIDIYKAKIENNLVKIPASPDTPVELLSTFEIIETPFYNTKIKIRQPTKWEELLNFRYTKKWRKHLHKWWLGYFSLENVKLSSV